MEHTLMLPLFLLNTLLCCGHAQVPNRAVVTLQPNWTQIFSGETSTVRSQKPKAELSSDRRDFPAGGSVTLSCSVNPSSGWKYFWYRGEKTSEPLNTQDAVFISDGQISVSQGGLYWCRGGRGDPVYYTKYSDPVSIDKMITNRAVVTLQPNWSEIYSGETITLRCEIKDGGDTEWEYEWKTSSSDKPLKQNEHWIRSAYSALSGDYRCKGRMKSAQQTSTDWSDPVILTVSDKPQPFLTVSPSWLSPGASVTLSCRVKDPSAGWRFFWFKAVPKLSDYSYSHELLPGSSNGTEQDSYIVHGQTHTAGYKCRAGRGDPVYYTSYSEPKFVWSGDFYPAASLAVSPDRVQHFIEKSVSLSCEGNSAEWRVRSFSKSGHLTHCSSWGIKTGSTCNANKSQYIDGVVWCESDTGQFSNAVNITVQNSDLILVSPVHPVAEGDSVTLSCKLKTQNVLSIVDFYKNGKLIQSCTRNELTLPAVSKSDEGFYKCEGKYSLPGQLSRSPESWMSVKSSSSPFPVLLIVGLVIGIFLVVPLPLLLCWYKKSKDTCCHRFIQSHRTNLSFTDTCCHRLIQTQRTNQSSAIVQTVNQDENEQQVYSSLLHGHICDYEKISGFGKNMRGDRLADMNSEYSHVVSEFQLKGLGKRRIRNHPTRSLDYCNVIPHTPAGP